MRALRLLRSTLKGYTKLGENPNELGTEKLKIPPKPVVKVGDFIQWTSGGVEQFIAPRKVEWVSEDGSYVRVFGSQTGIAMSEIAVVQPPSTPPAPKVERLPSSGNESPFTVYQVGKRLQITADVDVDGLKKLKDLLGKYEEILNMLN
jgi:hypothetical protein